MRGLIVGNSKEKYGDAWLNLILSGTKTVEIRGMHCRQLGEVALIESGSNLILGTAKIVDSIPIRTAEQWDSLANRHCVKTLFHKLPYANTYAWILADIVKFEEPIVCQNRKPGQVIWVKDAL